MPAAGAWLVGAPVALDRVLMSRWPYKSLSFPRGGQLSPLWGSQLIQQLQKIFALPVALDVFTVATLPSAATAGAGALVFVSDEVGGATVAFSDGTDWRRVQDRAVVS